MKLEREKNNGLKENVKLVKENVNLVKENVNLEKEKRLNKELNDPRAAIVTDFDTILTPVGITKHRVGAFALVRKCA